MKRLFGSSVASTHERRPGLTPVRAFRAAASIVMLAIPMVASCNSLAVTDLYSALDQDGRQKKSEFPADAVGAFCVAEVSAGRDDGAILILIRQTFLANGQQVDRVMASTEGVSSQGSTKAKFNAKLEAIPEVNGPKDNLPLPTGRFRCEVYLDGAKTPDRTSIFNVKESKCPGVTIQQQAPCAPFYEEGRQCPRYGASSKDPTPCTCTNKVWSC